MKKSSVLAGLFAFLIITSSLSFVSAGVNQAVIRIVPAQSYWMANGVTQYRVDVIADNRPLFPETTMGVQWRLVPPVGLENYINIVNASFPSPSQDFFAGFTNGISPIVNPTWNTQIRFMNLINGEGASNKSGILASYWFTISPGAQFTNYSFGIYEPSTIFVSPAAEPQNYQIDSVQFRVVKPAYPLATYSRAQQCIPGVNC